MFGLAEALAHLERALALWPAVPDAAELVKLDLAELCSWAAELASETGAAPRAVELARRAIELVGGGDPPRAALLHVSLARYLHEAVGATPPSPNTSAPSSSCRSSHPRRSARRRWRRSANGLSLAWRFDEALAICEQALALARAVGAHQAELRALNVLGNDLAYLGRGDEGLAQLRQALQLAEASADPGARSTRTSHSPTC